MRCVITGGAGFLGSHLTDLILNEGHEVIVLDDLSTGSLSNLVHQISNPRLQIKTVDVRKKFEIDGPVDIVFNLASPASPPVYTQRRVDCLLINSEGVLQVAEFALQKGARLVQASTSEVYGDPLSHPQIEHHWGNVNPIGERSCYDEGKRFAEALLSAMRLEQGLNAGIIRIFNTYGPRMHPYDGRVISGFVRQALSNEPLTVFGDGSQTRSFCYVSDLVRGLWLMGNSNQSGPINLGNPIEQTVLSMAHLIKESTKSESEIIFEPLPSDDPVRRRPDISKAKELLGWEPLVGVDEGLRQVINWQIETQRTYAEKIS
ncbi:NAD-dependent epimerase/dehydratase family protein [Corynebacterium glutamicum]|uniref:NAD-dependent epimerase/dehydratase family protein n=1 Tax=Corynebacterium glutamicum TaxID=1718 RepID=UPI001C6F4DE6|nr:NAD-dependent epimerase/dehydratase family protein [Corynebacterium glutamicum]QYR18062.1 NAD-dependent epimerase/dehydratase family protein [Corynebacterium glutamicum]